MADEYEIVDLEVDATGRTQSPEQKIARITQMFQSGLVHPSVAARMIGAVVRGVYVSEIETTRLAVKSLDAVTMDTELRKLQAEEDAARLKQQGMTPRGKPTI